MGATLVIPSLWFSDRSQLGDWLQRKAICEGFRASDLNRSEHNSKKADGDLSIEHVAQSQHNLDMRPEITALF